MTGIHACSLCRSPIIAVEGCFSGNLLSRRYDKKKKTTIHCFRLKKNIPGGKQQIKRSQGHVEEKQAMTLISTCSFLCFLLLWWLEKVDFWVYWAENTIFIPSWLCETTAQKQALPPSAAQREFVEFLSVENVFFIVNQSCLTKTDIKVEVAARSQSVLWTHNHFFL